MHSIVPPFYYVGQQICPEGSCSNWRQLSFQKLREYYL